MTTVPLLFSHTSYTKEDASRIIKINVVSVYLVHVYSFCFADHTMEIIKVFGFLMFGKFGSCVIDAVAKKKVERFCRHHGAN